MTTTGNEQKETALDQHEDRKGEAIRWLRRQMKILYDERAFDNPAAFVTADDARVFYAHSKFAENGYSSNMAFMGAVFRGSDWQFTGKRIKSKHPANNAREVKCWRFVDGKPVVGELRDSQRLIYNLFRQKGDMTHAEVYSAYMNVIGENADEIMTASGIRTRVAELVDLGLVKQKSATDRAPIVWGLA